MVVVVGIGAVEVVEERVEVVAPVEAVLEAGVEVEVVVGAEVVVPAVRAALGVEEEQAARARAASPVAAPNPTTRTSLPPATAGMVARAGLLSPPWPEPRPGCGAGRADAPLWG